ncbi:MAG: F0F1 ATP synthase subunit B [Clostridia bacterium]|nr:F0F1 ATP synthase subunit B [Clostridia bacterium]MBQ7339187.1 F0F1 ATP synthase subunit B [Clostridia bacterium]
MPTLDVISVNLWQIIISLINLLLLFLILKRFLYKPVTKMLAQRQAQLDEDYAAAERDRVQAASDREELERQLSESRERADAIIAEATVSADRRGEKIVEEAQARADGIIRRAQAEAEQEMKKAEATIKEEIVGVSTALTEKMLKRKISEQDHRTLIDDFIDELGEGDET